MDKNNSNETYSIQLNVDELSMINKAIYQLLLISHTNADADLSVVTSLQIKMGKAIGVSFDEC